MQEALDTCCKAGIGVLSKAGFDVAIRFIGSSTSSFPVAKSTGVGLGSATAPVMDLSPHFQPYSSAKAEQAGFKTDAETCGGVHVIFQRGFPFQPRSSHFGKDLPLLSFSVVLLNKSGFALQSHRCCHLQRYLGTAVIPT